MPRTRTNPVSAVAAHLADRVYLLRHTKRMTQAQLAKAIGCSPTTISGLERKQIGDISLEHLASLARVLGTSADALLGLPQAPADVTAANTYPIALIPAPEGGYTVIGLDLPGAVSQGETVEEAREMIIDAIHMLTECRREDERKALPPDAWEETVAVPR